MDTQTKENHLKLGAQPCRTPLDVIQKRPACLRHILMMVKDIDMQASEAYKFYYGWTDPRTGAIIILAHRGDLEVPVMLECTRIRAYRTMVTVYEHATNGR